MNSHRSRLRDLRVLALFFVIIGSPLTAEGETGDFASYKQQRLAAHEAKYSHLLALKAKRPALAAFQKRLALIDEVTASLVTRFQAARSSSLDSLLEDATALGVPSVTDEDAHQTLSASEILSEYEVSFSQPLPKPDLTSAEVKTLKDYYDAMVRVAGSYIAERAEAVATIDKERGADVLELCLVMPLLHVSDAEWSGEETELLPEWMRQTRPLTVLEDFCLQMRRPFTAYQFALYRSKRGSAAQDTILGYGEYLETAASRMMESRNYHAGIHCLKTGIQASEKKSEPGIIVALHLRLADAFSVAGHKQLAAEEVKGVLDNYDKSPEWGKAFVLRLKYLYEAGQFEKIIDEAKRGQDDKRCEAYLPQILYISWVTHRRENRLEEATKLQETFLRSFPKHPLGADMHFASAMTALAESGYAEALRLLEVIEYRYPDSRVVPKAKQIRERLEKTVDAGQR